MKVGIFDSGIGGLTVLKNLYKHYPNNEYIYFGDTLNLPYGTKTKEQLITNKNHYILKTVHPSPLSASRGFFGCKHFSKCNEYLTLKGITPINWDNN